VLIAYAKDLHKRTSTSCQSG